MEIYAIRHAESSYNKWAYKRIYTPWLWPVRDPMIFDAPLSEKGLKQAAKLGSSLSDFSSKIELIICSPLTRAIHTMQLAFPSIECPVIITPLIRERADKTCDIGTPLSKLKESYPDYEYLHFNSEFWWNCDPAAPFEMLRETGEQLERRQKEFVQFLRGRNEQVVVMITHGQYIKRLTGKRLQVKNCAIRKLNLHELNR